MQAFRDWFDRRLDRYVAWAGILMLVLSTLLAALKLPLDLSPTISLALFWKGAMTIEAWRHHGAAGFAFAYLAVDLCYAVSYAVFFIGIALRITPEALANRFDHAVVAVVVLTTGLLFAVDEFENVAGLATMASGTHALTWPTATKNALIGFPLLGLAILAFRWFFGFGLGRTGGNAATMGLRRAMSDILWRNRYNIILLALFAALVVVMDQSRDVLVAMAQAWHDGPVVGALLVTVGSALSLWIFAYSVWLSARILGRLRRDAAGVFFGGRRGAAPNPEADTFAKWWARLLGIAPLLVLVWLCGFAARDALLAGAADSAYALMLFAVVSIAGAIAFVLGRQRSYERPDPEGYYQVTTLLLRVPDDPARPRRGELAPESYRFLGLKAAPISLTLLALAGSTIVRALELSLPQAPSMSFISICLGMTFWIGVMGVLTQLTLLYARPYIAGVIVLVIVLGRYGWTDNHIVWSAIPGARVADGLSVMLAFHTLVALVIFGAIGALYWYAWKNPERRRRYLAGIPIAAVAALTAVLAVADRDGPRTLHARSAASAPQRPTLDQALKSWLAQLCAPAASCTGRGPTPVYFVSTEGGGIRAAYWTALALDELRQRIPDFERRTFSLSGVSGGAMGAAIYRACRIEAPADTTGCIRKLGDGHFLGPLISTWMFEDVLARILPTYFCETPGCGLMSRGAWFEQAMEDVWQPMHATIAETRARSGAAHVPYLLLNSTWVETGERAIASDLVVQPASFPTARDQLDIIGSDIPLSTAAHNAARFPYVNAIGSLHTLPPKCPMEKKDVVAETLPASCGHLADGGYFDNSGGHTTADVMRALTALLARGDVANAAWLRENLVPYVVMIRNGVEKKDEPEIGGPADPHSCGAADPALPQCKARIWLLTDLIGPGVTALNAVGTGANGRLAEALLKKEVLALRAAGSAARVPVDGVVDIDLTKTGVLYPLGWYLSPTARKGMETAACRLDAYAKLCGPGATGCPMVATCTP